MFKKLSLGFLWTHITYPGLIFSLYWSPAFLFTAVMFVFESAAVHSTNPYWIEFAKITPWVVLVVDIYVGVWALRKTRLLLKEQV